MAPKQAEMSKNPPVASSSEEEEESGSSGEESESSGENSNKDESSDDEGDEQSKPVQTSNVPVAGKKLEADTEGESESESDSGSDSDPEPAKKKKPDNTVKTKPRPETSGSMATKSSAVTLPAKRSLTQTEDAGKKKMKASTTEHVKKPGKDEEVKKISGEETKQQMFQRLFSETDEIALLQGILDFTSTRGDPQKDMDAFCDYLKKLIDFNANKSQLVTKIQRLKKKFGNIVKNQLKKGKSEDEIVISKDLDQKSFELSRKIWGNNGVMASKSRNKVGGNSKDIKLSQSPQTVDQRKTLETNVVVNTCFGRELAAFFKVENVTAFGSDESTINAGWDMVADGPEKREMEEKLKELKATQVELCLERTGIIADSAKVIFKDNASTSG